MGPQSARLPLRSIVAEGAIAGRVLVAMVVACVMLAAFGGDTEH